MWILTIRGDVTNKCFCVRKHARPRSNICEARSVPQRCNAFSAKSRSGGHGAWAPYLPGEISTFSTLACSRGKSRLAAFLQKARQTSARRFIKVKAQQINKVMAG
jgi:hypothetical protein